MIRKARSCALVLVALLPTLAHALGLGDIKLTSTLNAPLDAQIELLGASPEELATLKAKLASPETFARYGLDRPAMLNSVTLSLAKLADGRDVLSVHSTDSVTEPFVTFLIEADWARGRLVREYTLLLDPPVFTPKSAAAPTAAIVAAESGSAQRSGTVTRPVAPPAPVSVQAAPPATSPPAAAASPSAPAPSSRAGSRAAGVAGTTAYTVRRGDSLSRIVGGVIPGDTREARQAMVAIYRANPAAFEHNMNELRAGAVLRIPDASAFDAVPAAEAAREVRDEYHAWREGAAPAGAGSASGRLRLVPPAEAPAATSGPAAKGELEALRGQLQDLKSQLADSRRLLELRNADLAAMQAKLAATSSPATPSQAPAPPPPKVETAPTPAPEALVAPGAPGASVPAAEPPPAAAPPLASTPVAPPPAAGTRVAPASKPHVINAPPLAPSGSLFDRLSGLWYVPVGLLLLAAWFGFSRYRARQKARFDDQLGRLAEPFAEPFAGNDLRDFGTADTSRMRRPIAAVEDESFVVEESGPHARPVFEAPPILRAPTVRSDEPPLAGAASVGAEQADPLAEADFHMAYGLYDQAADLLRLAVGREPGRRDLRLKLLEVFFVWGNRDQFLATAHELAQTRAQAAPGEWDKVVIMGKQIAPEDPLFSPAVGFSGAAASGVDLDLEGGQNRIDFELDANQTLGQTLGDRDPTGESAALAEEHIDFLLDDPTRGADRSGATTREMTAQTRRKESELPTGAWSTPEVGEAPTVEQPVMRDGDNPTIRQKVEQALRQTPAAEQTAEVAIDDLGLDLGALDGLDGLDHDDSRPGPDAPTLVAGLDSRSRRVIEEAGRETTPPVAAKDTAEAAEGSGWLLSEEAADAEAGIDLGGSFDTASTAQLVGLNGPGSYASPDPGATAQIPALKRDDLDLDFGELEMPNPVGRGNGVYRGNGAAAGADPATRTSTQRVAADDLALPDLEPATMSEVGTKLDLARAYMDMGDPEGARNILHEVLSEGSVAQKQEAQRLIASLPG
jgi:pilus assembly protein FimV